jgi:hypothetical protein
MPVRRTVIGLTSAPSPRPGAAAARPGRPNIDLRPLISSHLMDQGARPVCLPFALSHAHDALLAARSAPTTDRAVAPEAIWWHCTHQGVTSAGGMLLEHGALALGDCGQPALVDWPWNPHLGVGTEDPPTAVGVPPWQRAQVDHIGLAHDGVEDDIEDALGAGRPVILVVEVTAEFENAAPDGSIDVPDIRSPEGDYHAVLVVGAATHPLTGRRLLIRNSWGSYWGAGGYGWLPLDYLVANALQAAVLVAHHSAKKGP